ncbi:MAG: hypothetical protein GY953_25900 [bacterium]|nr:hypothetical protein [bacterium]
MTEQMGVQELFAAIVAVTGKDAARIHRILQGGTLLDGGTRFRWSGFDASADEIDKQLLRFPDPQPARPFSGPNTVAANLKDSAGRAIQLPREVAAKRRFLRRKSLWDVLLHLADRGDPLYVTYSYREQADLYRLRLSAPELALIRESADLVTHSSIARQLRTIMLTTVEFLVPRS